MDWNTITSSMSQCTQTEFTHSYWCFALLGVPFFSFIFKKVCRKTLTNSGQEMATWTITSNNTNTSVFTSLWTVVVETFFNSSRVTRAGVLTWSLVSVCLGRDVVLDLPLFGSRHLLHLVDLGHAELGVVVEKHASLQDGQVVLGPVPQLPQILVVQRIKWVIPGRENPRLHKPICQNTERVLSKHNYALAC